MKSLIIEFNFPKTFTLLLTQARTELRGLDWLRVEGLGLKAFSGRPRRETGGLGAQG